MFKVQDYNILCGGRLWCPFHILIHTHCWLVNICLRLDFWVLERKCLWPKLRLWYPDILGETNYRCCCALYWLLIFSKEPCNNCHKIVLAIVMLCLAWMGRCALCVLRVVNLVSQGLLFVRIAWCVDHGLNVCAWQRDANIMICASWIYYVQSATANSWFFNWITTMIYPTLCSFNSVAMIQLPLSFAPTHAIFVRCFGFMALLWCLALQTWMQDSWSITMAIMLVWNWNAIWRVFPSLVFLFDSDKAVKAATIFYWVFVHSSMRWLTVFVSDAIDSLSTIVTFVILAITLMVSCCTSVLFPW